ncbi:MAG: AtpZ/AtpI family protein [Pseudomonadota bacterium]|nr:AtpZ/AtpI family protein [Pseudomonadota bacterium]
MSDNERHRGEDRLQEIDRRIERMRDEKGERQAPERHALPAGAGAILGRVATEIVAGVIVGAFIGWALDRWLGTSPLFLVMLFFLGAAAGMLNVWRMVSGRGMATGYFNEHRQNAGRNIEQDGGQPSRKEDDR